jgi:hypothetical protein
VGIQVLHRIFKPIALIVGLCGAGLPPALADGGTSPLVARLELKEAAVRAAGPVQVRLVIENVSSRPILIARTFSAVMSPKDQGDLEYPDTKIFATVKQPGGKTLGHPCRPILGTRTVVPSDFVLLAPGSLFGVTLDLVRWPLEYTFQKEGPYTAKFALRFVAPQWLEKARKSSWLVDPSVLAWLAHQEIPLFGGVIETNTVEFRLSEPQRSNR